MLLVADGEQSEELGGDTVAIGAAARVKGDDVTVFGWGFGQANLTTLQRVATDPSKAVFVTTVTELSNYSYIASLEAAVCDESPPPSLPPSPPPPTTTTTPPSPPRSRG